MRQPSTLDLRPSARASLPSSSSLSVRSPLHTLSRSPPAPTSPTGIHHHPVRAIVRSLSFSLGQVRLTGPSPSPYPCPQPYPCPRCLSNLTLANPSTVFSHHRYSLIFYLSPSPAFPSRILRLFTTFTLSSVGWHHRANFYAKLPMVLFVIYLPT